MKNFKPRYKITDKIVSEINNSPLFNNEKNNIDINFLLENFLKKIKMKM